MPHDTPCCIQHTIRCLLPLSSTREGGGGVHWGVDRDPGSLCMCRIPLGLPAMLYQLTQMPCSRKCIGSWEMGPNPAVVHSTVRQNCTAVLQLLTQNVLLNCHHMYCRTAAAHPERTAVLPLLSQHVPPRCASPLVLGHHTCTAVLPSHQCSTYCCQVSSGSLCCMNPSI
jgi:hypothetical protein